MWNKEQLDRIEKSIAELKADKVIILAQLNAIYEYLVLVPVSPEKAPKKRVELSNRDENAPKKRKYVKSGKYSKKVIKGATKKK